MKKCIKRFIWATKIAAWSVRVIYGYWYKNRMLPYAMVIGVHNQQEIDEWSKEIGLLNDKHNKKYGRKKS